MHSRDLKAKVGLKSHRRAASETRIPAPTHLEALSSCSDLHGVPPTCQNEILTISGARTGREKKNKTVEWLYKESILFTVITLQQFQQTISNHLTLQNVENCLEQGFFCLFVVFFKSCQAARASLSVWFPAKVNILEKLRFFFTFYK